jgi:multiple sugar transport system ATP-binding protein
MSAVELEEVSKQYAGGVKVVDSINLTIADGEFVVLVGPSGCGKTTTLRMIAGLEEISEGEILIGGRVVNQVAPKDRNIAMVFQNYALYPHMTVYKNLAFGLKLRGMPKAQIHARVTEAARILEIEHLLDRKPKQLSGGQRQRVAVGRAIVREPAAFLFDEPLSNLDAKLRVTTRAELKRLHHRLKTTTIYVTHDQEEAMTLGDRIVVMKDGQILQADTPLQTYNFPANRFVAGFIGMPPMNFFDGSLKEMDGQVVFQEGEPGSAEGFTLPLPAKLEHLYRGSARRPVVLGIRPEHFSFVNADNANTSADSTISMRANVVEPLGKDMDIYLSTKLTEQVVARVDAHEGVDADTTVQFSVDLDRIHLFEPGDNGVNLAPADPAVRKLSPADLEGSAVGNHR